MPELTDGYGDPIVFKEGQPTFTEKPDEIMIDDEPAVVQRKPQKTLYRFGVVETCYHQAHGQQPTGISESRFSGWIDSDEQPYGPRFMTVGTEWKKVDRGWVERASLLIIKNETRDPALIGKATVQVGVRITFAPNPVPFCEIPAEFPSHSIRLSDPFLDQLYVRCVEGETRVTVVLYPA